MEAWRSLLYLGLLLLSASLLRLLGYWWGVRRTWRLLKRVPGPRPWPLLGNVNELGYMSSAVKVFNPLTIFMQNRTGLGVVFRNEKLYHLWVGLTPVVVLLTSESVEPLLKSNALLDKGAVYQLFEPWLGNGLLLSKGETWKRHRKLLTPTFHFRILDNFLPVMNEQSAILVRKLAAASRESDWVDAFHYLSNCTLDIICETAMGFRLRAQEDSNSEYVTALSEFLKENTMRVANPWLRFSTLYKRTKRGKRWQQNLDTLHAFTESLIRERIAERKTDLTTSEEAESEFSGKRKLAFLDLLLEMNETGFSTKEVREQVDTFMFAGHDTTSTALSWVLYLLGLYPEVQSRLLEEVEQVFADDKHRAVTQEDMKQLKYMDCVMKEGQRLYPAVPGFARRLTEDLRTGGHLIPEGVTVGVNTYQVHHDPDVYPDPEVFDPDRFSPENSADRSPFAFIPFSAGARNCIGQRFALMEEKVVLCQVLRHFRVTSLDQRDKILLLPAAVLRTDGPLRLRFQPRVDH